MKKKEIVDSELASFIHKKLKNTPKSFPIDKTRIPFIHIIHAWDFSPALGKKLFQGWLVLHQQMASHKMVENYCHLVLGSTDTKLIVREALASFLPEFLLMQDDKFLKRFLEVFYLLQSCGLSIYDIEPSIQLLAELFDAGDIFTAISWINLLHKYFSLDLGYQTYSAAVPSLPRTIRKIQPWRRKDYISYIEQVLENSPDLFHPALKGIDNGLYLLDQKDLHTFFEKGVVTSTKNLLQGELFFALESADSIEYFQDLQVGVKLTDIADNCSRYLLARTERQFLIEPLSKAQIPLQLKKGEEFRIQIHSDGRKIYLPGEIHRFSSKQENVTLVKCLLGLEAGLYEWKTFDFDLELLCDSIGDYPLPENVLQNFLEKLHQSLLARRSAGDMVNDFSRLFSCFEDTELARDLFTICEHTRQHQLIKRYYPGMWRRTENLLMDEIKRQVDMADACPFPLLLYSFMAVNESFVEEIERSDTRKNILYSIVSSYTAPFCSWEKVEDSGALLIDLYPRVITIAFAKETWEVPFGRNFNEAPYSSNSMQREQTAAALKSHLEEKGRKVYKAQIRAKLEKLESSSAVEVASYLQDFDLDIDAGPQTSTLLSHLQYLRRKNGAASQNPSDRQREKAFSYPEWDFIQKRYKPDFVTVTVQRPRSLSSDFYNRILREYDAQVSSIRNTFERMKPEKISFERRATDGDEFDYDALTDHRIDRKIRRTPSQNIYLRKKKDERDIATLLLVDLSRSTNNPISDSRDKTVLDLEKEAIVLFCEALSTVGDTFEVAGFSGFDRHGVEYHPIKDFKEEMGHEIQSRIASITSIRGTRTGAAIRHAISRLEQVAAKVKILLYLGDGFPNDEGYRKEYAFEDTQKAVWEAESKKIKTRFITVNISHISRLDELYGQFRNNVISDIQDLPNKMVGIYRNFTR